MNLRQPEFIVYTGPMASGKSSMLLSTLERYKYQSKKVYVFKPYIDDRYSDDEIVTHSGLRCRAVVVKSVDEMVSLLLNDDCEQPDVVALDEAFMLPGAAKVLTMLYKLGITVLASTLDISAKGVPFSETMTMLSWATKVVKCAAVCTACGADAYYTHCTAVEHVNEIHVGGLDIYEPRCLTCHPAIKNT